MKMKIFIRIQEAKSLPFCDILIKMITFQSNKKFNSPFEVTLHFHPIHITFLGYARVVQSTKKNTTQANEINLPEHTKKILNQPVYRLILNQNNKNHLCNISCARDTVRKHRKIYSVKPCDKLKLILFCPLFLLFIFHPAETS